MQRDIRKWFMKAHDKGNDNAEKKPPPTEPKTETPVCGGQEGSGRRKTSKYFVANKQKQKEDKEVEDLPVKRKAQNDDFQSVKPPPSKKVHKFDDEEEDDDDFSLPKKKNAASPSKKLKSSSGRGIAQKPVHVNESDEDDAKDTESPLKSGGRGRGGRGVSGAPSGGRGRGGGRGGFMNFGERKDPPHKGEKEVPEGAPNCLAGLTFVISGTLDSLEREEAEDLIKRHGGRVTGSVSKKTSYLLCDEDIEGRKSSKAKELGTPFLTEDGLFDKIRSSKNSKAPAREDSKVSVEKVASLPKKSPQKADLKSKSLMSNAAHKDLGAGSQQAKQKDQAIQCSSLIWTEKYRPKVPNEMIGNQSLVTQLHNWLKNWNEQFHDTGNKGKGKKQNDSTAKKAVLLSGPPGIGKTTSAKLVSKMLGFQAIEVNASDNRGKADAKIFKGISGSNANCIKELISNESLGFEMDRSKHLKTVLIMDEVDGMSAGDRGGVADLIASIKISKIPIICICNDRYSQKLKSLVNYCLLLSFRKPTKQQMAKRLNQVAGAEGLQVNEIALEELAERVNGDMRMALNQLQYMSLSMSVINYDDVRQRLQGSAKDEDISPFTAVDKLFGFSGGKLRMDERIDLSMSDPDLVPLLIQENYINYRPSSIGKDDNGMKRMSLIARAAESIADGDIINVQIRRYRQWQLSQTGSLSSCIIPAALLHGSRETLEQGERNFNRFGGWLGKNSTAGKNLRLLEDLHVHLLASRESNMGRETLRLDYLTVLLKQLTDPLRVLPKDEAVEKVVEFMNIYSISQDDMDTIVELSKFQGHGNPLDGIPSTVKAALTRAYKGESKSRMVRAADLVTLPGKKKAPKKRVAAILEPSDDGLREENGDALAESEEENSSDTEDMEGTGNGEKLQSELQSLNSKGIQVEVELKCGKESSKSKKTPTGRGKGGSASTEKKPAGRGRGGSGSSEKPGAKRKR
ncbi:PREDICTED: replication factor C subunit 1 [Populus euphratica]|uniref:Replication factor C subunit 1 n=1 Tax=Populus euphratica TaxID=75702 RepID=A0AAJ6UXN7_POPEU|nr:PREDICTED: replication factor C subunit 1 [Populus euphratica]XP_011037297.1 PREDICTED: replication factor C subunit 1 [Populus euphratica]